MEKWKRAFERSRSTFATARWCGCRSSRCCPALSGAIIIPYRAPNVKGFWEKIIIFSSFSVHIKIWWKLCQKMQHSILHLLFSKVKAFWKIHFSLIIQLWQLYIFISLLYRISFWFFCVMNTNLVKIKSVTIFLRIQIEWLLRYFNKNSFRVCF